MTNSEAENLAKQLGITLPKTKKADALLSALEARDMTLGVDQTTGDWVVLKNGEPRAKLTDPKDAGVYARCS